MFHLFYFVSISFCCAQICQIESIDSEKEFAQRVSFFLSVCSKSKIGANQIRREIKHKYDFMHDIFKEVSFILLYSSSFHPSIYEKYICPSLDVYSSELVESLLIPDKIVLEKSYYLGFDVSKVQDREFQQLLSLSIAFISMCSVQPILENRIGLQNKNDTPYFVKLLLILFHYRYHCVNDINEYTNNIGFLFAHLFIYFTVHQDLSLCFHYIRQKLSASNFPNGKCFARFNCYSENILRLCVQPLFSFAVLNSESLVKSKNNSANILDFLSVCVVKCCDVIVLLQDHSIMEFPLTFKSGTIQYRPKYAVASIKRSLNLSSLGNESGICFHAPLEIQIYPESTKKIRFFDYFNGKRSEIEEDMLKNILITHILYEKV